jgi:hypothetical protein
MLDETQLQTMIESWNLLEITPDLLLKKDECSSPKSSSVSLNVLNPEDSNGDYSSNFFLSPEDFLSDNDLQDRILSQDEMVIGSDHEEEKENPSKIA